LTQQGAVNRRRESEWTLQIATRRQTKKDGRNASRGYPASFKMSLIRLMTSGG
jgi:hypothetical protein